MVKKLTLCFLLVVQNGFAQSLKLVESKIIPYKSGFELIKVIPDKGILHFNSADKKSYNTTFYDFNLEQKYNKVSEFKLEKRIGYLTTTADEYGIHLYFLKSRYIGLHPKTKMNEIFIDNKTHKSVLYTYKIDNDIIVTGVNHINGKNIITGFEQFKPWGIKRILKLTVGLMFFYPVIIPAVPHTRPFLAQFERGEVKFINRELYMDKKYKNYGIHDILIRNDEIYLGFTNGLIRGKQPIIVEHMDKKFAIQKSTVYDYKKYARIGSFIFDKDNNDDTMRFFTTITPKLMNGFIAYDQRKKKDKTMSYDGSLFSNKIKLKKCKDKTKSDLSNDIYENLYGIKYATTRLKKTVNGEKIEVIVSEKITAVYDQIVTTQYNATTKTTETVTRNVLAGYYFSDLTVKYNNLSNNTSKVFALPDHDKTEKKVLKTGKKDRKTYYYKIVDANTSFYHFVHGWQEDYIAFHSVVQFKDDQFYVTYAGGINDRIVTLSVDEDGIKEISSYSYAEENTEITEKTPLSRRISDYHLQRISDESLLVVRQLLYAKKRPKGENTKKGATFKQLNVFNIDFSSTEDVTK